MSYQTHALIQDANDTDMISVQGIHKMDKGQEHDAIRPLQYVG
jgi:hypothetical protein